MCDEGLKCENFKLWKNCQMNSNLYQIKTCECVTSCWARHTKPQEVLTANGDNDWCMDGCNVCRRLKMWKLQLVLKWSNELAFMLNESLSVSDFLLSPAHQAPRGTYGKCRQWLVSGWTVTCDNGITCVNFKLWCSCQMNSNLHQIKTCEFVSSCWARHTKPQVYTYGKCRDHRWLEGL